ncbi:hypothetical protein WG904_03420 [Pedobacter sp. Du54]|uniref:hypothetical protein n=1 Tax=Pedobacter anseongensis TaxID=3133439 RepID=UPI0030A574FC
MLEIIGVLLAVIALWLGFKTYNKEHIAPHSEKLKYLEDRFIWGQKVTEESLARITSLYESRGNIMFGDVPLKDYSDRMKQMNEVAFNDHNLSLIRRSTKWTLYHDSVMNNIELAIETIYSTNTMLEEMLLIAKVNRNNA